MHFRNALRVARGLRVSGSKAMAKGASWLRPLTLRSLSAPVRAH